MRDEIAGERRDEQPGALADRIDTRAITRNFEPTPARGDIVDTQRDPPGEPPAGRGDSADGQRDPIAAAPSAHGDGADARHASPAEPPVAHVDPARAQRGPQPRRSPQGAPRTARDPGAPIAKPARRWPRRLRIAAEVATLLAVLPSLGLLCSVPSTGKLADENPASTAFIDLRRDQAAAAGKPFKLQWQWKPAGKISRYLRAAVVYAEDINFYTHSGVDWGAISQAFEKDWDRGKMTVGGSTITQQLAKNLYLSPNRSYFRKAREMLIAFSLEDHLSKQRILELYLNVVEWGDGVFGAEAASKRWFGHSAISLSPAEAARLAIALPNPITRAPNVHTRELTEKAVRIIRLFRMQGLIDAEQERAALDQVGASGEAVLPDRGKPPTSEPPPTNRESPAQPSEPPPSRPPPSQPATEPRPVPAEPPPATEGTGERQPPTRERPPPTHDKPPSEPGTERPAPADPTP